MRQCLRCSKPCEATSVFCETCRSHLRSQIWQASNTQPWEAEMLSSAAVMSPESAEFNNSAAGNLWDRSTGPQPAIGLPSLPQTPLPSPSSPSLDNDDIAGAVDRAIQRLNEAAQRIAEVDQGSRRLPHASRLSPLRDISADIHRHST